MTLFNEVEKIGVALEVEADAFLTNDIKLKQIKEIKVLVLRDFLRP